MQRRPFGALKQPVSRPKTACFAVPNGPFRNTLAARLLRSRQRKRGSQAATGPGRRAAEALSPCRQTTNNS